MTVQQQAGALIIEIDMLQYLVGTLGRLGERSVVPDLLGLLADKQVDVFVRKYISRSIEQLANDDLTVRSLATMLLQGTDVADAIYTALWTVSRRAGVRVFLK